MMSVMFGLYRIASLIFLIVLRMTGLRPRPYERILLMFYNTNTILKQENLIEYYKFSSNLSKRDSVKPYLSG